MTIDLDATNALDLAAAIRAGVLTSVEATEASLARIAARDGALNAVVWLDEDQALTAARAADARLARVGAEGVGPLHGVPIPVKDLYHVAGQPATYGSTGADDAPRTDTSLPVQRLLDAGMVLCGRTNTPEFGTVTATENDRYGITRNPWDLDRTSGGSSGGASSAVAGGLFAIAHASDGGGSIRIPASCTGLVGLKPSRGRVVDEAVSWEGAATQGVVTRTVSDTAAALDALAVPDPLAWWNAPAPERPFRDEVGADPGRLRVCLYTESPLGGPVDPECVAAAERCARALVDAGHEVVDHVFAPHPEAFVAGFVHVVNAGMAEYDLDWDRVQANDRANRGYAQAVDSLTYTRAVADLQRWSRTVNAQWGRDFDLLVTPTMPIQPYPAGQVLREITDAPADTSMTVLASVSYTSMFNMNGLPAISLPVHHASDTGLPIGAQVVAGPFQDGLLLRVATQVESAIPWRDRRPDVSTLSR